MNPGSPTHPCPTCGTPLRKGVYCSKACMAEGMTGEGHHRWVPRVKKKCPVCRREFELLLAQRKTYCSGSCYGLSRRTMEQARCEGCGRWFLVKRSRKRFCSMECYQGWRKNDNRRPA